MSRGLFITLEGIEGAGKSTNLRYVQKVLADAGKQVVVTREPGGTELGEKIRELLLDPKYKSMSSDTELLLIFAARAEHITKVIRPALEEGQYVLCDRFTDATYAYQGGGRGIPGERIAPIEKWVQGELRPDLTLLFDFQEFFPIDLGLTRANGRSAPDRFEIENNVFFEKVRKAYLDAAAREPKRIRVVDASRTREEVKEQIRQILCQALDGC